MSRYDNIARLHRLLTRRHQPPMPIRRIMEELECSEKTARRAIDDLRDRFGHPIVYDAAARGWRYENSHEGFEGWELPGLWFNESELTALVTMRELLKQVHPGVFEDALAPFGERIEKILEDAGIEPARAAERIRVLAIARRSLEDRVFRACADAVLARRRLTMLYTARGRHGEQESRRVSPQRLVRYRDNWYLDAWCHSRDDLRTFALDCMQDPQVMQEEALEIGADQLDGWLKSSYGIFSGESDKRAVLRFTPHRALWVSREDWHHDQTGAFLPDGSWELTLPYSKSDELVMDILKYGPDVEVIEPAELREQVAAQIEAARCLYR